jgi:putative YphP/YqiW family bacilliredoxin
MALQPMYDSVAVQPMRDELAAVGCEAWTTPEAFDKAVAETPGTLFVVVNSVCGCAAGAARPGVALALQHKTIPDRIGTVFAGMDREAVERVRALHAAIAPPSSPSFVLLKGGRVAWVLPRHEIERLDPAQVAQKIKAAFDTHCSKPGPSISPESFAKLEFVKACGSSIPRVGF